MYKLDMNDYKKVLPLLKTRHQLTVYSVIYGIMPGKILVNNQNTPTAALIRTGECNLIAGSTDDEVFNSDISKELTFWDTAVPDSESWAVKLPSVHPNKYVFPYTRCHYELTEKEFLDSDRALPPGYLIEQVNPDFLRKNNFSGSDDILESVNENWGNDENYLKNGGGAYIRNENEIISWSMRDCTYEDKAEIGIVVFNTANRKKGFGILTAAATIKECFKKGYKTIGWHCVGWNKGSRAVAEKLGFKLKETYTAFTPYCPIENNTDLSADEWNRWGEYFEKSAQTEPRLWSECLAAYIKANNLEKADEVLEIHKLKKPFEHSFNGLVRYLHSIGLAGNFSADWGKVQ